MTGWSDLLATALIGTDRRSVAVSGDPAAAVLEEAAAWSAYRRAGRLPTTGLAAPSPAPPETRPVIPPASAARLARLLGPPDGDRTDWRMLLWELLAAAAERGYRVPPETLPELLENSRRDRDLLSRLAAAGGARFAWLAAQNPAWARLLTPYTVDEASLDERKWWDGTTVQRAAFLAQERRSDPDAARRRLEAEWDKLDHTERAELLGTLRVGLGPADEPLIESTLDDRRREVREVARRLARALPGSAFNARALARARACLVITGEAVEIALPSECDAAMRRDGIEPNPPKGEGERTWWLRQIMANVPIGQLTDVAPTVLLRLSDVDTVGARMRDGLAGAAIEHRDATWAAAILDHMRDGEIFNPRLLLVLGRDEQSRRLIALLRREPSRPNTEYITTLLRYVPTPWTDELSAAVLELLPARVDAPVWPFERVCAAAAFGLPVRAAPVVARIAHRAGAEHPDHHRRLSELDRTAAILYERYQIIEELT